MPFSYPDYGQTMEKMPFSYPRYFRLARQTLSQNCFFDTHPT